MEFLKNNKRFSFKMNDKNVWDLNFEVELVEDGSSLTTIYNFKNGIKVTNIAKKYDKYGAYEWVNYIENTSDMSSEIISELWDCDCSLPLEYEENRKYESYFPDVKTATKIYAPSGSTWSKKEFYTNIDKIENQERINHIYPGQKKKYTASGGRSSEKNAPFFNVSKNGNGYIFGVGWTGQWNAEFYRDNDKINFRSGVENTHFKLMPGEKLRTTSIIMPYNANDVAHNKWRKLVKEHFLL